MISSDRIARLPEFGERARGSVWALSRFPLVNYLPVAPVHEPGCQLVNHVAFVQLDSVDTEHQARLAQHNGQRDIRAIRRSGPCGPRPCSTRSTNTHRGDHQWIGRSCS
jgi:hypothetical protein